MNRSLSQGTFEVSFAGVVLLGTATVVASAVVFLLGVYVGKGIAEQRFENEQSIVRLPASPQATPRDANDVTFYDRLEKTPVAAPDAAPTAAAAEAPIRVEPPAKTGGGTISVATSPPAAPTAAPEPTTPLASEAIDGFQVQVAAVSDQKRAQSVVKELAGKGFNASVSPAVIGGKTLYRVRVGRFAGESEARDAMARLRKEGYPEARLAAE